MSSTTLTLNFNVGDKIIFTHKKQEYPGKIMKINKKSYSVLFKLEEFPDYKNIMGNRYVGDHTQPDREAWRIMNPSKIIRLQ